MLDECKCCKAWIREASMDSLFLIELAEYGKWWGAFKPLGKAFNPRPCRRRDELDDLAAEPTAGGAPRLDRIGASPGGAGYDHDRCASPLRRPRSAWRESPAPLGSGSPDILSERRPQFGQRRIIGKLYPQQQRIIACRTPRASMVIPQYGPQDLQRLPEERPRLLIPACLHQKASEVVQPNGVSGMPFAQAFPADLQGLPVERLRLLVPARIL